MTKYYTGRELLNANIPSVEYLVDKIIKKEGITVLYGPPGVYKTNLGLWMSCLGADGKDIFGLKVKKPFKTLWIDEENGISGMKTKFSRIAGGIDFNNESSIDDVILTADMNFNVLNEQSIQELKIKIRDDKPDLIAIDSIAKIFLEDERDEREVKRIFSNLKQLMRHFHVSFLLIHHSRKIGQKQNHRGLEDMSGSREFGAMIDSALLLQNQGGNTYMLSQEKNRYDEKIPKRSFEIFNDKKYPRTAVIDKGELRTIYKKKDEIIADSIIELCQSESIEHFKYTWMKERMMEPPFSYKESSVKSALKLLLEKQRRLKTNADGEYFVQETEEQECEDNEDEE